MIVFSYLVCIIGAVLSEFSLFFSRMHLGQGLATCIEDEVCQQNEHTHLLKKLLTFRTWSALAQVRKMTLQKVAELPPDLRRFYDKHVAVDMEKSLAILSSEQHSLVWRRERKCRINASKAREQFTYYVNKKADWTARYKSLYHSSFSGNADTDRSLKDEPLCRDKYIDKNKCTVFESGLLVRPEVPWLGVSLDGTVLDERGNLVRTLEIKSFKEGTRLTVHELVEMKAISTLDENCNVKVNTPHYAQMQLGMLVSGMEECHYCLWSGVSQDFVTVSVLFDEKHCIHLCSRLVHVYFEKHDGRSMWQHF